MLLKSVKLYSKTDGKTVQFQSKNVAKIGQTLFKNGWKNGSRFIPKTVVKKG